jgi:hypothetical protein
MFSFIYTAAIYHDKYSNQEQVKLKEVQKWRS